MPQQQGVEIANTPSNATEPTPSSGTEESTFATITAIESALHQLDTNGDYSIFISREVVARPPFPYFYGLVKYIARAKPSLGWDKLLLEEEVQLPRSKKEKVCEGVMFVFLASNIFMTLFICTFLLS
jgi:hypothetical protein